MVYENEIRQLVQQIALTDDVTYYHSLHVACLLARFTETAAGQKFLKQAWVTQTECITAGLLHEIGKVSWPRDYLLSSDRLAQMDPETLTKFWTFRIQHPLVSESMILEFYAQTGNRFWERIARGVLAHHENFDGSGYPYGLKGTEIPLLGRGLRVVDSYAAMTEYRRYRDNFGHEKALKDMRRFLGCRFDAYWGAEILSFLEGIHGENAQPCANLDQWLEEFLGS